jgi:type I restriction enzyme M protein
VNAITTFFARAEHVGRKPNGDDDVRYTRDGQAKLNSDFPEILKALQDARSGTQGSSSDAFAYIADVTANLAKASDGLRLDYQFHHPSRQDVQRRIEECAYRLAPLHALCTERSQSVVPAQDLAGTTIPYTGLAQIESYNGRAIQEPTPADSLKSQVRPYEPGDILFARMRPNLRKVVLVEFDEPGYSSPECAVLVVKKDAKGTSLIDPLALSVILRSDFVYCQIVHLVAGIGRPRISQKQIRDVLIPVPPLKRQIEIREEFIAARSEALRLEDEAVEMQKKAQIVLTGAVSRLAEEFAKRRGNHQ